MSTSFQFIQLVEKAKTIGLRVYRGERPGVPPADPGDFGAGTYWSTRKARARQYGSVRREVLIFKNPLAVTVTEAYDLAEKYDTLHAKDRVSASRKMSQDLLDAGYDAVIAIHGAELEIVDLRNFS